ncbi:MAG: class I SAM-dependent methyltransferase [Acidobacteriota bacterium]
MAHERRFNAAMAGKLENPERLQWLPPAEVVTALSVKPGEVIADIGAGTGYFALPIARAASPGGKVYAVDAQAEMLSLLQAKLSNGSADKIELIRAEADATGLPGASCDLVFMANVWHEFDDRVAVVKEAQRILRAGGRIGILDWRPDVEPEYGPPLEHRLAPGDAVEVLRASGAAQISSRDVGKYSWLVIGTMPRNPV